jgi:Kef-type K+ transport system membrane component KefB
VFVTLLTGIRDLGGAMLLGIVLGIPSAFLSGRLKPGEPTLIEATGIVLLCGGLAIWLNVSFLLASMVLGAVIVNVAKHHDRPFSAIENIDRPFMILFFVFAGATLHVKAFLLIGVLGIAYIILRIIGRLIGAWIGGLLIKDMPSLRKWMGIALMPQAGVALGMALVATSTHPELTDLIMPVVIGSTVFFELLGPVCTRIALVRVEESRARRKEFKLYRKHH